MKFVARPPPNNLVPRLLTRQKRVVPVIGETENWGSMGTALAAAAKEQGVEPAGLELPEIGPGFHGLQISIDSRAAAKDVATELIRLRQRIVILLMFHRRNRLVLCEAYNLFFERE